MCRITLATMTNWGSFKKSLVMHELMLLGAAEPYQKDGWGFSDGVGITKSVDGYNECRNLSWRNSADPNNIWMGHVRAASNHTGLNVEESHPFLFRNFIGCHNGTMVGTGVPYEGEPNSDSWRCLRHLDYLIQTEKERTSQEVLSILLDGEIVNHWLSAYFVESAFVFALLLRTGEAVVIRGDDSRSLHVASAGDGFLVHTTKSNLEFASIWAREFSIDRVIGEIEELDTNTLTVFYPGGAMITVPIAYQLQPEPKIFRKRKKK